MKLLHIIFLVSILYSPGLLAQTKDPKKPTKEEIDKLKKRVVYPKLIKHVPAVYPQSAIKENREGIVQLTVSIDETGKVIGVEVKKSAGTDLDEAAKAAVMQFVFSPATIDGKAIAVKIPLAYPFKLKKTDDGKTTDVKKPDDTKKPDGGKTTDVKKPDDTKKPDGGKTTDVKKPDDTKKPDGGKTTDVKKPDTPPVVKDETSEVAGTLWEKGRRYRVKNAEVKLWKIKGDGSREGNPADVTYSSNRGEFTFKKVSAGNYYIDAIATGYRVLSENVLVLPSSKAKLNLYLERSLKDDYNILVTGKNVKKDVARYTLELTEVQTIPGTQGDAIRAIQNMPGVARSPFNLGLIVVRGSAPRDTRVFFEGHEIPQLFHFLGLTSIFNSDLLKNIDFVPGNFSVRYGRATGGIIDIGVRNPKKEFHGYIDLDIWDASALVEGPIGEGSFALSLRRSWIDGILRQIPEVGIAPVYYDYQGVLSYPILGGNFKLLLFGSDDRLYLLEDNTVPYITNFQKIIALYNKRDGKDYFKASIGGGLNDLTFGIEDTSFNLNYYRFNWRGEYQRSVSKNLKLSFGLDGEYTNVDVRLKFKNRGVTTDPDNQDGETGFFVNDYILNQAFWAEAEWKPFSRLTLVPGIRTDFLRTKAAKFIVADPRITARYELVKEKFFINSGLGIFHQEPEAWQLSPEIFGNPNLEQENSLHASLGFMWKIMPAMTLEMTGFYKNMWNLIVENQNAASAAGVPEYLINNGLGRVFGGEFLLKKQMSTNCPPIFGMKKCFGWLSYTLLKSERKDNEEEGWKLFGFDQTHILTAIFSGMWNGGWQVGFRFRLSTGIPITPIVGGVYDADSGRYTPVDGKLYSERMPTFHQLDFRIDKKFTFNTWSLTMYLDIQNVYNYQVSEFLTYNFNYTKRTTVAGLPIIPSIGIKGSF
ncbi:TonB family protein [Myxococcota bacterium]|nr:TonB family protein [Myxococcota bacterium]MBU1380988.1 TonB family protein [Myxococcota bacterium]MBU1496627.1 TonB family protein [Myxococcota bacterium]